MIHKWCQLEERDKNIIKIKEKVKKENHWIVVQNYHEMEFCQNSFLNELVISEENNNKILIRYGYGDGRDFSLTEY